MNAKAKTKAPEAKHEEAPNQEAHREEPKGSPVMKITPISKISVKTVCGTPETAKLPPLKINVSDENPDGEPNPAADLRIMRVAGYISGVKSGQSTYGEWRALAGEATAINLGTGEIFASANVILPGPMNDMLYEAAQTRLAEDASAKMAFKVDVFVRRSARDKNKYEYTVRPVIETEFKSPALALLTAD